MFARSILCREPEPLSSSRVLDPTLMSVPGEPRLKEGTPVPEPMTKISIIFDLFSVQPLFQQKSLPYLISQAIRNQYHFIGRVLETHLCNFILQNECCTFLGRGQIIISLLNVAMLIVKKKTQALQEYISVNAGKVQIRLLFLV